MALVGCGALGTVMAPLLVRAGIGFLRIVDRDFIEMSNLQRQTLFDEEDIRQGYPKAVAAARKLSSSNSEVTVEPAVVDFGPDNAESCCGDVDLVMDASDNFEARYLHQRRLRKAQQALDLQRRGWRLWRHDDDSSGPDWLLAMRLPNGSSPRSDGDLRHGRSDRPDRRVVGSLATAEAIKLLVGAYDKLRVGLTWIDVWNNSFQSTELGGPVADCQTCQLREFEYLAASAGSRTATLCGRSAVQVRPIATQQVRSRAGQQARVGRVGDLESVLAEVRARRGPGRGLALS